MGDQNIRDGGAAVEPAVLVRVGALTIFGCFSSSQRSRSCRKKKKEMWNYQHLSSVLGEGTASSWEPSLPSLAFFAPLKALELWLRSQELTGPGRTPVTNHVSANLVWEHWRAGLPPPFVCPSEPLQA